MATSSTSKSKDLTFDDYVKFLEEMIAVSQLYYEGSTSAWKVNLLSYVFWKAYSNKPTLSTMSNSVNF
jgi:hypothetical protein